MSAAPLGAMGWTTRLALEERDVIQFGGRNTWWHVAYGLFDVTHASLAFVDGELLVGFGDQTCFERLHARVPELRPLDLERLKIEAIRHPAPETGEKNICLSRPSFDLIITEP